MVTNNNKVQDVIEIKSMTNAIFNKVIEFLYTGKVEYISPDSCIELLSVSNMIGK